VDDAARSFGGRVERTFDPDKLPPEPPEILDVFENQRYICKVIQWGQLGPQLTAPTSA
jgi:hypothetical protein